MPATLVGFVVALIMVLVGAQTHHVNPVFLVTNVTADDRARRRRETTMMSYEFSVTTGVIKAILKAMLGKERPVDLEKTITTLVEFARKARGEGLLALESEMAGLDDPFMKREAATRDRWFGSRRRRTGDEGRDQGDEGATQADGRLVPVVRHLRPDVRHHRRRGGPHRHPRRARQAGEARRRHRRCVRRHLPRRVHRERRHAAAVRPHEADVGPGGAGAEMVVEGVLAIQGVRTRG
ncbi:MAG: hypothetical protein R2713_10195 [Ilumatobacteraceae bacterium]